MGSKSSLGEQHRGDRAPDTRSNMNENTALPTGRGLFLQQGERRPFYVPQFSVRQENTSCTLTSTVVL